MPIRASSLVLRASRTFNVVAPSGRTVCQSLPPSNTSPESLSPSNEPPGTTPIRRYPSGVAPTICRFLTFKRITNNGWVLSVLRTSGRLSSRLGDTIAPLLCCSERLGDDHGRSRSGLAAIDSDNLAGEVVHLVGSEEHDRLSDLFSRSSACLLATYIDAPAAPRLPIVDDRLTMLPCRWASITRISCLRLRIVPSTLVSKVAA